ncbi:hypothetical protein AB0M28_34215, partial [Streptomyces sp. NPDC051940]
GTGSHEADTDAAAPAHPAGPADAGVRRALPGAIALEALRALGPGALTEEQLRALADFAERDRRLVTSGTDVDIIRDDEQARVRIRETLRFLRGEAGGAAGADRGR